MKIKQKEIKVNYKYEPNPIAFKQVVELLNSDLKENFKEYRKKVENQRSPKKENRH